MIINNSEWHVCEWRRLTSPKFSVQILVFFTFSSAHKFTQSPHRGQLLTALRRLKYNPRWFKIPFRQTAMLLFFAQPYLIRNTCNRVTNFADARWFRSWHGRWGGRKKKKKISRQNSSWRYENTTASGCNTSRALPLWYVTPRCSGEWKSLIIFPLFLAAVWIRHG